MRFDRRQQSRAGRDDARSVDAQVAIGAPHLSNPKLREEDQGGSIDVGQFVATQAFELLQDGDMMRRVEGVQDQPGKIGQCEAECARCLLTEPMQEHPYVSATTARDV